MSRRNRHFNPAQVVGARGAWDARRTGLADGRMASWPALPGSVMAGPTQVAADNTRPVLVNGVRAYAQFNDGELRRLQWYGAPELATFQNQGAGVIIGAMEAGTSTAGDQPVVFFSTGTSVNGTRYSISAVTSAVGPGAGGRRLDADSPFVGAGVGTAPTSGTKFVVDGRANWAEGNLSSVLQNGTRATASVACVSGAGSSENTVSLSASVGSSSGGLRFNGRLHAFCILRPASPISASDAVLRRIQQHYCVCFGIPYRS